MAPADGCAAAAACSLHAPWLGPTVQSAPKARARRAITGLPAAEGAWPSQDPHRAYKFGPQLGRGEFGTIHLVSENSTGASYACKVLAKGKARFSLQAVRDEVRALRKVRVRSGPAAAASACV